MKTTRINISRLYNSGNYEHVRYEISVDLEKGDSARDAIVGLEKILTALAPESKCCVQSRDSLKREAFRISEMAKLLREQGAEKFTDRHGTFVGTPQEYIMRCRKSLAENVKQRAQYEKRAAKARALLDSLGGAAKWKDAKLDWEGEF